MNSVLLFMKRHATAIRLIIVASIFLILFRTIDPHEIAKAYLSANPLYLSIAALLMIPNIGLQVMKWHFVLRTLRPRPTMREATVSVLGGFFLGAATPGRTGEFARGAYLKKRSLLQTASLTIVDKGFNQAIVVVVGLVSIAFLVPRSYMLPVILADIAVIFILLNIHRLRPSIERLLHKFVHSTHADNALAAFDAFSSSTVVGMTAYSIAFYLLYVGQYYIMLQAFIDLPYMTALKTLPVIYFVNFALPVALGDLGVKEMTAVYLIGQFGAPGEAVLGATLLNTIMTFFIPSAVGGVLTVMHRFSTVREAHSSSAHTTV